MIFVEHDEAFSNDIATKIIELKQLECSCYYEQKRVHFMATFYGDFSIELKTYPLKHL